MRRIVILSYTEKGRQLNSRVSEYLEKKGDVTVSCFCGGGDKRGVMSTSEILRQEWNCCSAFVFIGALGIAVRHVAPFLQSKASDPAVLVLDEKGQFVIPVASGHIGGGVCLAWELARYLGAQAVITTATDVENQFAVDVFAQRNHLWIENPDRIKSISSALLRGGTVDVWTSLPIEGDVPEGVRVVRVKGEATEDLQAISSEKEIPDVLRRQETGIGKELSKQDRTELRDRTELQDRTELRDRGMPRTAITIGLTSGEVEQIYRIYDAERVCELYPGRYILGIGCKKGKTVEELEGFLQEICKTQRIDIHEIGAIASIDVKKEEKGIWELSRRIGVDFEVFTQQELEQVEEKVTPSEFVKETVGVDNVCERSAYCLARRWAQGQRVAEDSRKNGRYSPVMGKQSRNGMTMALVKVVPQISW